MRIKRISYESTEDANIPKYMISFESVKESKRWVIKKVFVYRGNKWFPHHKYSCNNGMGIQVGVIKHIDVDMEEYFDMLVKYEGYSYDN